jgi:hypothetical protein
MQYPAYGKFIGKYNDHRFIRHDLQRQVNSTSRREVRQYGVEFGFIGEAHVKFGVITYTI